jgi:hypothetical protein
MTFSIAHWILEMMICIQLTFNVQEEDITKHTNAECHVLTF